MNLSTKVRRLSIALAIGLLLILFPILIGKSEFYLSVVIITGIFLILAIGFQFLLQSGILNFGHVAFMGVGGYASAFLVKNLGLPFLLALPIAGIASAMFAGLFGYPTLRVAGVAFFMISLSLIVLFQLVMTSYGISYFGGSSGISGIPYPTIQIPGLPPLVLSTSASYYYLTLVIVALTLWFFYRLERGRFGKTCLLIGSSEVLARSLGINIFRNRMIAFIIACFFAGIAGSLYAHYMTIVTPVDFGLTQGLTMQVYAFIGGVGSVFGPLIGAIVMGTIGIFIMDLGEWEVLVYGFILVVIIIRAPGGLWGILQRIRGKGTYERGLM